MSKSRQQKSIRDFEETVMKELGQMNRERIKTAIKEAIAESKFSRKEAEEIFAEMGLDPEKIDFEEFAKGMNVELEHGLKSPETNITNDDQIMTAKIALAHLNEIPNYYTLLAKMEKESR